MSDTPRTDAEVFRPCAGCVTGRVDVVSALFARRLESELNAANRSADACLLEVDRLRAERDTQMRSNGDGEKVP